MSINAFLPDNGAAIKAELLRHLQNLIRIDTRTHLGQESRAAAYLSEQFAALDIPSVQIEPVAGKGSIVASLPGLTDAAPLLLLSHLDTVHWAESEWDHHPLSGDLADGYIWGRGAVDCKGLIAIGLTILRVLKAMDLPLQRSVIMVSTADEESGGAWGAQWLTERTDLLPKDAWVLSEGGGFPVRFGGRQYFLCQTGEAGLIEFAPGALHPVQTLLQNDYPVSARPATREFIRRVFRQQALPLRLISQLPSLWERALAGLQARECYRLDLSMFLRPLTLVTGSDSSVLRARIPPLPVSPDDLSAALRKAEARIIQQPTESPVDHELFWAIESVLAGNSGTGVLPYLTPGMSDNRFFRARGNPVFGFYPLRRLDTVKSSHGRNERVGVDDLHAAFLTLFQVVKTLALGETLAPAGADLPLIDKHPL